MADGEDADLPEGALLVEPAEVLSLLDARIAKLNESSASKPAEHAPTQFPAFERQVDSDLGAHLTTVAGTTQQTRSGIHAMPQFIISLLPGSCS